MSIPTAANSAASTAVSTAANPATSPQRSSEQIADLERSHKRFMQDTYYAGDSLRLI